MLDAFAIHAHLGADGWRQMLSVLGVDERFLKNKHGPCPACGGKDRFRFDNRKTHGDFFCGGCGAGDGFQLLMRVNRWTFAEARLQVISAAGLQGADQRDQPPVRFGQQPDIEIAKPTRRVTTLVRESCRIEDCEPAMKYLESRALWPMTLGHTLRAHPSVEYWHERQKIGVFAALVGAVRDIAGELVTAHVTYLERDGRKLADFEPRKLLSGLMGREGCAVQIQAAAETLGIAEGIETALSASRLHGIPVWAALNTSLLARFTPPQGVTRLVIFADRDVAGLDAASKLMERLQGRLQLTVKTPQTKDWNDVLRSPA